MKGATSLSRLWAFLLCNCCLHSVQLTIVLGTGLSIGELSGHHLSLQWLSIVGSDCGFGLSIVGSNCHHNWLKALSWEGTLKFQLGLMARNISTCVTVFEELSSNCFTGDWVTVLNWAAEWMTTCVTRIDQKNEWQRESSLRALTVTSFSAHLQVKHLDVLCTMCTAHLPVSFYLYSMHLCKSFLFQPCHQLVQGVQLLPLSGCHKSTTLRGWFF